MSIKILFSDFDGTLFINSEISPANRDALRRWRATGHYFCLASGRNVSALRENLAAQGVEYDYLLCLNGAEGYDRESKQLFSHSIDGALLPGLFETMLQGRGWANVCMGERAESIYASICSEYDSRKPRYGEDHLATFPRFTQICSGLEDIPAAAAARDRVLAHYGEFVSAEINGRWLDVDAVGVRKSTGIASLLEVLDILPEEACAVGDNFNDLCMLEAYHGYAVENASEEFQKIVGRTVPDVAHLIDLLS